MEKHGDVNSKSFSDFTDANGKPTRAKYFDKKGFVVADEANKDKLMAPVKVDKTH